MSHRATIAPVSRGPRPTWSVMIPTYNCARYLDKALSSVLAQDPGPASMQIEVVDDASEDDPESVVRQVGGDRVGFFRHPSNVGHIRNFTTCIERARGHYVHLLHGDDFVHNGFYDALRAGFESDPAVGGACSRWRLVDEAGAQVSVVEPRQPRPGLVSDALEWLASEQQLVTPSIAVRRSAYERLGSFDERLRCAEDWEMWVRIAAAYKVWYDPRILASYRTHANSNTGRHHRDATELRYTAMAIELFRPYLPSDRSKQIVRRARRTYARTALGHARSFALAGDGRAARAHLGVALRLSRSPRVLAEVARVLPTVVAG